LVFGLSLKRTNRALSEQLLILQQLGDISSTRFGEGIRLGPEMRGNFFQNFCDPENSWKNLRKISRKFFTVPKIFLKFFSFFKLFFEKFSEFQNFF
jgi:hypothetical protein